MYLSMQYSCGLRPGLSFVESLEDISLARFYCVVPDDEFFECVQKTLQMDCKCK